MPAREGNRLRRSVTLLACAVLAPAWFAPVEAVQKSETRPAAAPKTEKYVPSPQELQAAYQRPGPRAPGPTGVYKDKITPHWLPDNKSFWYRNDLRGGYRQFVLVDVEHGARQPAFDHERLASAIASVTGTEYHPGRLPFDSVAFVDGGKAIEFKINTTAWKCDLKSYKCTKPGVAAVDDDSPNEGAEPLERLESLWPDAPEPSPQAGARGQRQGPRGQPSPRSPDEKWLALVKDDNVFIRSLQDGNEIQLSQDGKAGYGYSAVQWSPDSRTLVAFRVEPGDDKEVYLIESSPKGGGRAKLHARTYALPGDKFSSFEINLFEIAARKHVRPEVERIDSGFPRLRWRKDKHHFTYEKVDRGHQRFRLIEVDSHTGKTRDLIDEKSKTFIWTAHTENLSLNLVNFLDDSGEIIYASERDGWRHLYLIDTREGKLKNQITTGNYVVRGIDRIDEAKRQIWFRAGGRHADQDPYFMHYYRVNFDGSGLVALTEGNGNHTLQYSPDQKYLIDTYSRVDMPPVHELRRVSDGALICELEKADISELMEKGWRPPEVFVAKGRDGKTDIWGIICRPRQLDPGKKYAVIEHIYAGPHGSYVPKTFSAAKRFASLTDLGFIVVQVDGMGTANRSKAFHDVCWHNLKDAGFPDRMLWHQTAAEKYPYYDTSRLGIYGTSAGGQSATGALLFHADFYKAAVSACGCHDNRMDKASWNEQWMGYPVGPHYSASSNIDNARRLSGKLLLIVGEMDTNVPPESTLRLADALIKAGKDFELLVIPGMGHSNGGPYGNRRLQDFFVRHLHGVPPPDHNSAPL